MSAVSIKFSPILYVIALPLILCACAESATTNTASKPGATVDRDRLMQLAAEPGTWITGGRDIGETHYSPLTQIKRTNLGKIGLAWEYQTGTDRGLEATPIVVDGVMFTTGNWGTVYALNAATGRELWKFVPPVDRQSARYACCDIVNRGLAIWRGRIYVAALDGQLFALDAATGNVIWKTDTVDDKKRAYTVTGAPRIAGNVVVIGNGGAEFDARGYITAYDLDTGEQRWRFYTVPAGPKKAFEHPELAAAAKTWDPKSRWDVGGGGTVYDAMVYDPDLNLLYIGTGNAALYDWYERSPAGGDNLYLASILAINPDNGRMVWHYQQVPGERWDYTATQPMILADLELDGAMRKVIMQAPKNGFFYVLDRETGELLRADPFARVTWADRIDMNTGRPVISASADYRKGPAVIAPAMFGAHNWQPMAWSPRTKLVYIPAIDAVQIYLDPNPKQHNYVAKAPNLGVLGITPDMLDILPDGIAQALSPLVARLDAADLSTRHVLRAFNPVTGKKIWEQELGEWWNSGGVLVTGSDLVIQGSATGQLNIFDARDGTLLHSIETGSSLMAAPMTYSIDGNQYIAIMAGFGGGGKWQHYPRTSAAFKYGNNGRILVFKLGGRDVPIPAPLPAILKTPKPTASTENLVDITEGEQLFGFWCSSCHFNVGRGGAPNLHRMSESTLENFDRIVLDGLYQYNGMPRFDDSLSSNDTKKIRAYLSSKSPAQ